MYKKLQRKFLWGSALVLFLIIIAVICIIFTVTVHTVTRQSQVFIDLVLDNEGYLPDRSEFAPHQKTFLALNNESIHEMRFFSVRFYNGEPQLVSMHIAELSESDAINMSKSVLEKDSETGRLNSGSKRILQYGRRVLEDGSTLVVIADSTSRYGLSRLIIFYMAALWFVVLVLFIIVMSRYSKKLVRPFVENDEKQKQFITNASHELKTPLAVISANNEMAEAISGKTKWTESTRRQVKRLQTLIEDLVVLARLDEMKEFALTDTDLSAIVNETAEPFRSVVESSGRQFQCNIDPNVHAHTEKRAFQQVTTILLDNATKYCDKSGTVAVSLSANGKVAVLTVSNSYAEGKNVDTSRFFERFYRQDESHNSGKSGFGIGLSMAKEITERMKGKLKVSYSDGVISFSIEI